MSAKMRPAAAANAARPAIEWEARVPLATNRRVLRDMALAFGLGSAIAYLLVAVALVAQGEWGALKPLAIGFAAAGAGLFLLGLLVMLLIFGNRMTMRFRVDAAGAAAMTVDRRARIANRLAIVAGALARKPGVAGAGLIAAGGETMATRWAGVRRAVYDPGARAIALRNRWRTVIVLYCAPENYDEVAETVRAHLGAVPAASRPKGGSPLPALLGWTAAVIAASFPAFVLPYPLTLDLLMPMIMLAFALATVWLVPLFGYVIFFCAAYLVIEAVLAGVATRRNQITGQIYSGFDTLDGGEWVAVGLFAAGLAFLVWFGLRAVRGRIPAALATDAAEIDKRP
jgi:hypothetical protein